MSHANSMAILNDYMSHKDDDSTAERIDHLDSTLGVSKPLKATFS